MLVAMNREEREFGDRRGLRFPFDGHAEILLEGADRRVRARVTELSFRGCFLEIAGSWTEQQRMQVKILHTDESFEASAHLIYVRAGGIGLLFDEIDSRNRNVLQDWILNALDNQAK
jgi:hypothetical protein